MRRIDLAAHNYEEPNTGVLYKSQETTQPELNPNLTALSLPVRVANALEFTSHAA